MTTDCISNERMGSKTSNSFKIKMKHVTTIRLWMNDKLAYGNCSRTTFGTKLIKALRTRSRTAVCGYVCCTHWCGKNTVTKNYPAQLDRACKVWILIYAHDVYLDNISFV